MFIKENFYIYLKLICVALLWGGTFIAGRVIAFEIPPQIAALFRFIIASILLICLVVKTHRKLVNISFMQHLYTAGMGLTGIFAYNIFFFNALAHMEAGRTALFVSLSPILTIIAVGIFFKEHLSRLNYLGVFISFIGTFLVVSKGHFLSHFNDAFGWGELMMSCAVLSWVAYTLFCKKITGVTPLVITTYSTLWGTLFLFLSSLSSLNQLASLKFNIEIYLSIIYLGAFGTVLAFIWYTQGISRIGVSRTVIFNNFVPIFAVLLSFLMLSEPITWSMSIGGALSFIGVILTNSKKGESLNSLPNKEAISNV
jgi:drug/metabolite transporter (DMT)-like permease